MVEDMAEVVENDKFSIGIFIDLQKAFDTIDHSKLLRKLNNYGIRGIAHFWLKSNLENRKQCVQINETLSGFKEVTCGVPQGSVIGPKLFLRYINDICKVTGLLKFVIFADDTNLFCSGKHLKELVFAVERKLEVLKCWFDVNKLSLNIKKTKFIVFGNRTKRDEDIELKICNDKI